MRWSPAPLCLALMLVLSGCSDTHIAPEAQPSPLITAVITGAITDSLQGAPRISRYATAIDQYEFQVFAELTKGWYQFIVIWGEGTRPRVGTYPITAWLEGEPGTRMHAMFSRDTPGGAAMYQAVTGELRITASTPQRIVGEFTFHGVAGYLLPERAVLSPEDTPIDVHGRFSASCDVPDVCR
jgi:hypothetical protein